jgi:transposase InsO family protein
MVRIALQSDLGLEVKQLPSISRLSVLFRQYCPASVQSHAPPQHLTTAKNMPQRVHQRWQIDTKEKVRLSGGGFANILEIRDPLSAVMLASQAFETTRTRQTCRKLLLGEIQCTLRAAFLEWGKPLQIQTDHEDVYTGAPGSDFPTFFTLWLVGLGIEHVVSRRNRPTDQGCIERNHRTLGNMSWKDAPLDHLDALQQQLDEARARYNAHYPSQASDCQGRPPLLRHPEARFSGRAFLAQHEYACFNLSAADRYLAQYDFVRRVDCNGRILLGNQHYSLGRAYRSQSIHAHFLPEERTFLFETSQGNYIKALPAKGLEISNLTGLLPPSLPPQASVFQLPLPLPGTIFQPC